MFKSELGQQLQGLIEPALSIWADPAFRENILRDIFVDQSSSDGVAASQQLSNAIIAGLGTLGLPVTDVCGVDIERNERRFLGDKTRSCRVRFSRDLAASLIEDGLSDEVFTTWVHEHVHGRMPFPHYVHGWWNSLWVGYEEGLAECTARWAASQSAHTATASDLVSTAKYYERYYLAYVSAAAALDVQVEQLIRSLWIAKPYQVREQFGNALTAALAARPAGLRAWVMKWRLRRFGDSLMHRRYRGVTIVTSRQTSQWTRSWKQLIL